MALPKLWPRLKILSFRCLFVIPCPHFRLSPSGFLKSNCHSCVVTRLGCWSFGITSLLLRQHHIIDAIYCWRSCLALDWGTFRISKVKVSLSSLHEFACRLFRINNQWVCFQYWLIEVKCQLFSFFLFHSEIGKDFSADRKVSVSVREMKLLFFVLKETEFAKNGLFRATNTWRQRRHHNTKLEAIHSKKYISWQTPNDQSFGSSDRRSRKENSFWKSFSSDEAVPFHLSNRQLSVRCVPYMIPSSIAFLDSYINQGIPKNNPNQYVSLHCPHVWTCLADMTKSVCNFSALLSNFWQLCFHYPTRESQVVLENKSWSQVTG